MILDQMMCFLGACEKCPNTLSKPIDHYFPDTGTYKKLYNVDISRPFMILLRHARNEPKRVSNY